MPSVQSHKKASYFDAVALILRSCGQIYWFLELLLRTMTQNKREQKYEEGLQKFMKEVKNLRTKMKIYRST